MRSSPGVAVAMSSASTWSAAGTPCTQEWRPGSQSRSGAESGSSRSSRSNSDTSPGDCRIPAWSLAFPYRDRSSGHSTVSKWLGNEGRFTIGITGTPNSKIHACADHVIDIGIRGREPGPVPGTISFLANLATLYWLGLAFGLDTGRLSSDEAKSHRQAILVALGQIREVAERNEARIGQYVEDHSAPQPMVLVGGGPNWATAHLGVAKLLEAALVLGVVQELEEWVHEQYFLTGPHLHTVLIGADGVTADRLSPTAHAAVGLGAPLALVLPEGVDLGVEAAAVWTYPAASPNS